MSNTHDINNQDIEIKTEENNEASAQSSSGEFKVTVRKLEMPVRPRGVLAE